LRVLIYLHSFAPGGTERVALRLCRHWIAAGIDVRLVMGRDTGAMRGEAAGLTYETLSDERISTARWETLSMIARLPAVIRRDRPDIIFCAGNSYSVVAVAMKRILGRRCPPVVAKISNDLARADMLPPVRWGYRRWLRIQARHIERFVGMAPPMRAEIAQAMQIAPETVAIIDDPALARADVDRLADRPADPPLRARFVAAGRLVPQKDFAMLLTAFARIAQGDDTLTILGEGAERPSLERLVATLGIAERVSMPGHVPDLAPWLAKSDVFALSSSFEGVPAVIAEALAAGLAIVATACSVSMTDMLGYGAFGSLTPPGDVAAFAHALDAARTASIDREAMRAQAMRFTVEVAAARYIELFAAAVADRAAFTGAGNAC